MTMTTAIPTGPFSVPFTRDAIEELLRDLFVLPRKAVYKWSKVTHQTAQVRLAYPGQHLASVVTGTPGSGTAARGDDLQDGSEVKSCSRADQLGKCNNCGVSVLASFDACPVCKSVDIDRKTDSHWIFTITTEDELALLVGRVPRVVFVLFDRPSEDVATIRIRMWEVWPAAPRHRHLSAFAEDYYVNNFKAKVEANLKPAPCNLHPLQYDFYLMNPVPTFHATIADCDGDATIEVSLLVAPDSDRALLASEPMPTEVLAGDEFTKLFLEGDLDDLVALVDAGRQEEARLAISAFRAGSRPGAAKEAAQRVRSLVPAVGERARASLVMRPKRIKTTPSTYRRR